MKNDDFYIIFDDGSMEQAVTEYFNNGRYSFSTYVCDEISCNEGALRFKCHMIPRPEKKND